MKVPDVIVGRQQSTRLHGLWMDSDDRTISRDIPTLSSRYMTILEKPKGSIRPFYVVSKDYEPASGTFRLFVGSTMNHSGLDSFDLPEGTYATVAVRPKFGFLWGLSIGQVKQLFYTQWLPASEYDACNMEYEYHTEKSFGKKATVDLKFAIKKKI